MRVGWRPNKWPLWLAAFAGFLGACDPQPHFEAPEDPIPGSILTEESLVTNGTDQQLGLLYGVGTYLQDDGYRIRVHVPGGAYPKGTHVTVRLIAKFNSDLDWVGGLDAFANHSWATALQILPSDRAPERPLHIEFTMASPRKDTFMLVHTREGAESWSVMSRVDTETLPVSFDATQAGLWSTVSSSREMFRGRLERISMSCDGRIVSALRPMLLDLSNGVYTATTIDDQGCRVIQTTPMTYHNGYLCLDSAGTVCVDEYSMMVVRKGGSHECEEASTATEMYRLVTANSPDVLPPEPAACQTQEGA